MSVRSKSLVVAVSGLTVALSLSVTGGFNPTVPFDLFLLAFSLLPAVVFVLLMQWLGRDRSLWQSVSIAIFLALQIAAYGAATADVRGTTSSTAFLIFLWNPVYLLPVAVLSVLAGWVVERAARLGRRRRSRSSR